MCEVWNPSACHDATLKKKTTINVRSLKPISLSVVLFTDACERIFIKKHSFESRCVTGPENILFAGGSVHFQPGHSTGWGSVGVKKKKKKWESKMYTPCSLLLEMCKLLWFVGRRNYGCLKSGTLHDNNLRKSAKQGTLIFMIQSFLSNQYHTKSTNKGVN